MDDRELLDELVRVATRLGVEVRIEPFETPPARGGGRCLVEGREFILLDARAPLGDRVGALASALSDLDLDDVYVTPEARDRVEEARDARVQAREGVPLGPLTTMGVGGPARWYVEAHDEPRFSRRSAGRRSADSLSGSSAGARTWWSPTRGSRRSSSASPSGVSPCERRGPRSSSRRRPESRGTTSSGLPSSGGGPASSA